MHQYTTTAYNCMELKAAAKKSESKLPVEGEVMRTETKSMQGEKREVTRGLILNFLSSSSSTSFT